MRITRCDTGAFITPPCSFAATAIRSPSRTAPRIHGQAVRDLLRGAMDHRDLTYLSLRANLTY